MTAIDPAIRGLCALSLALIFGASGRDEVARYRDVRRLARELSARADVDGEAPRVSPPDCSNARRRLACCSPRRARSPPSLLLVLLTIFTGAIAINLARGRTNIDCGCFGPALRQELSGWLLLRNLFLMIVATIVILPTSRRALEAIDHVTIVLGALTLVILYASANFAIGNAPEAPRAGDDVEMTRSAPDLADRAVGPAARDGGLAARAAAADWRHP